MKKRIFALAMAVVMALGLLAGCGGGSTQSVGEPVTLTIAGGWTDCRAIEAVGRAFTEKYPNCTVVYEYLQDYYDSLAKRMEGEAAVDFFFTTNIQAGNELLPWALDLKTAEGMNLSDTFSGLLENFTYYGDDEYAGGLYAIPLGAEMRGLFVNKTLLDSLSIAMPTDQKSLLAACAVLKEKGYIPFGGNPGDFGQTLLYPWVCNLIANADDPAAVHAQVEAADAGVSELFRAPFDFLYTLVENDYYDYKTAQTELNLFNETTDDGYARDFFHIVEKDGDYVKVDDVGNVAFLPSPLSRKSVFDKTKDDYHSEIEYVFMPAPVGEDGGFAYLSPAHGIAANKASPNAQWAVKFLDFLFQPENNELFAETFNIIPNTKQAFTYLEEQYDIPAENISELGQVTFSYGFYSIVSKNLTNLGKANNPKYMQQNADGTTALYPLDHYMNELEAGLTQHE